MNQCASRFPIGERDVGTNLFLVLRVLLQPFCKPLEPLAERGDVQSVPFGLDVHAEASPVAAENSTDKQVKGAQRDYAVEYHHSKVLVEVHHHLQPSTSDAPALFDTSSTACPAAH